MGRDGVARHARPSGRRAYEAAYDSLRRELLAVRAARLDEHLEAVRLAALTEALTGQVTSLQHELASVRDQLEVARSVPPLVVEVPAAPLWSTPPVPSAPPVAPPQGAYPGTTAAPASPAREDLLLQELAEMRRLVAHQQQLLADLTIRLLDLVTRLVPVAPAAESQPARPYPGAPTTTVAADLVMDDDTASRLRVIREAFGR